MAAEYGRSIWETRDKDGSNGHEDLLVFGYSCKLFRDNDKALYLEKGNHLIPWMGDNSVMVDRYDVRGALYDLSEAESGGGGDRWEGLTEEERAEEERCDYERYLALYNDEFQYQAFQDEEAKRLMAELGSDTYTYSQVGFNYDGQAMMGDVSGVCGEQGAEYLENHHMQQDDQQQEQEQQQEQSAGYMPEADEATYIPPTELNVPQGMVVPETIKQNKIIVKTSKFIVTQGGQMEIIIKTKQADNPMFGFLSFDNPLNAYYKHMVAMIKSGRYTPADEVDQVRSRKDSDGNGDQYLHPSLSAGIKPDLAPGTPTSALKPSSDCAYFKLIHKIKEKQKNTAVVESHESPAPASPGVVATSTPVAESSETPAKEKKAESKASTQPKVKQLVDYPSFNRTREYDSDSDEGSESSPTASKGTSEYSNIKWPPPDVQMVIDKMASYIIKNGVEFETMVRSRDDPRFSFLKKDHEYYPYYKCKIRLYNEVYGDIFKDGVEDKASSLSSLVEGNSSSRKEKRGGGSSNSSNSSRSSNNNSSKQTSTICFSIKSREQDVNLDRHSTFPVESSSSDEEDMDEEEKEKRRMEREERRRKRKIKEKEERERREKEERERKEREEKEKEKEKEKAAAEKMEESTDASGDNDDMYDIFKYAQEMDKDMDTEDSSQREKAASEEPGKECSRPASDGTVQSEHKQQERRKKAAMFLSRLKKGSKEEEGTANPVYGPQLPPEIAAQILNSDSQSPRSSLASTRQSTPSRSRSHSASPGPGVPMPPKEAPAPPPPPPPAQSPPAPSGQEVTDAYRANRMETSTNSLSKTDWTSIPEPPPTTESIEQAKSSAPKESSVLSGASEDGRRSQSLESRRSKSRPVEVSHREKTRSRKKQRHGRSESRSPSSRRERKKRKRSRSRSRRHKKRRSRSRSPKPHKSSHKKKRRKHSSRHEREGRERKSKKSRRRSVSSSSSDSSSRSYSSSRSTTPSDNDVQVIESPGHSKRGSRASSVISVGASDLSHLSSALGRITEECTSPPLPPIPPSPAAATLLSTIEEKAGNSDSVLEVSGVAEEPKEEKKEEKKPLFDPQNSAAMAKIAQGLRAKVHALLNKESKL